MTSKREYWQSIVEKNKDQDLKWHKKILKAWPMTHERQFKKIVKAANKDDAWKIAHILQVFCKNHPQAERIHVSRDYFINLYKAEHAEIRNLLSDYKYIDKYLARKWLVSHLQQKEVCNETVKEFISHGAYELGFWSLRWLAENNHISTLDILHQAGLISRKDNIETIQNFLIKGNNIYAGRLMKYLPEEERALLFPEHDVAVAKAKASDIETGWHKIDPHSIAYIQKLPGDLICQDIFNFYAREIKSVSRAANQNSPQIAQTIRHFNDMTDGDYIKCAAAELAKKGGNPDPHKSPKKRTDITRPAPTGKKQP